MVVKISNYFVGVFKLNMNSKCVQNVVFGSKRFRGGQIIVIHSTRLVFYHATGEETSKREEEVLPPERYEKAFLKLKKWSHLLKEVDLIGGRLVNIYNHSRVFDEELEHKMHSFKSISRTFIGLPLMQETMMKNLMASFGPAQHFQCFSNPSEREELKVTALTKVADILSISAQQRKLVRHTISPQVTQHHILTGALEEILMGLRSEIEILIHNCPNKHIRLAHQIVVGCVKSLEASVTHDLESTSWMRLASTKGAGINDSRTWEDFLAMSIDLINCLSDEKVLAPHVSKLDLMKEGLYHIRDVLVDKNIGYKETRHQEYLVQKKLTKALGHSSRCLFTLLLYYLYGSVEDIEVEVRGGVHAVDGGSKVCLYMGKILASDEEKVVRYGVKQLDRALGLFKFVWQTAGIKGDLELQGHLWSVGAENRFFQHKGNAYFLHGISI